MLGWILLIILILLLIGSFPIYPYSRRWRYYPSGALTFLVIVVLVLLLAGLV